MNSRILNTLILLVIAVMVTGAGYYVTNVRQAAELQQIEDAWKLARMQKAEVEKLLVEEASTTELAEEAVKKWRARYKYIPETMETPDIIQYLESLTRTGFEAFNINLAGVRTTRNFKYYTFTVGGTAYYESLYDFVWQLENNREFYRIDDFQATYTDVFDENPDTGERRRLSMVKFNLTLTAYFDGVDGLSATTDELMPGPAQLLPARYASHAAFFPQIRPDPPPNDELLVDMENATLVSILGGRAVVEDKRGQHILSPGDAVYLGEVTVVDPINISVQARLNKGGVVEIAKLTLEEDKAVYRRAAGDVQLRSLEP